MGSLITRRQALVGIAGGAVTLGIARIPTDTAGSTPRQSAEDLLRAMSLEDKVGQLFVVEVYGQDAYNVDAAMAAKNQELYGVNTPAEVLTKYRPGGVIYYTAARGPDNLHNPRQIARLSNGLQRTSLDDHGIPLIISIDQEGGLIFRMPTPPATALPGNMALGAARSTDDAFRSAEIMATELDAVGVTQNYAPVGDVNINPDNPVIGVRSFGADPALASELAEAVIEGQRRRTVASAAKHFPGHGDTSTDSHFDLPEVTHTREELEAIDFPPFRAAIAAEVDTVMTAHVVVKALDESGVPATMSHNVLTGVLREEMGFEGLIVTDALDMQGASGSFPPDVAPVEALKAGADMLVLAPQMDTAFAAVLEAVRGGAVGEDRVDASVLRILEHKIDNRLFHPFVSEARAERIVGHGRHVSDAAAITDRTITLVKNDEDQLPLSADAREVLVTGWDTTVVPWLAEAIGKRDGQNVTTMATGAAPSQAQIDDAVAAAQQSSLVVVSSNALAGTNDKGAAQASLVKALLATGTQVVVIAVRNPYDIRRFTDAPVFLCTYNPANSVSLAAAVRAMYGDVNPGGKLPVAITAFEDPETELFPLGHGLSY